MKRIITLLLALALVMSLLTSCELMVPGQTETPVYDSRLDSDPNFVHGDFDTICATEDTVYFAYALDGKIGVPYMEIIHFLDKATGIVSPLCGKPECLHNDSTCNAYTTNCYALSVYDGRLYWMEKPMTYSPPPGIYSAALDGTDRRMIWEFEREMVPSGLAAKGIFHQGWFFLFGDYQKVENGEPNRNLYMVAWPLNSEGESIVILDEPIGLSALRLSVQGYGDKVYIIALNETTGVSQIFRWSLETWEQETVYDGGFPYDGAYGFVMDGESIVAAGYKLVDDTAEFIGDAYSVGICRYDFGSGEWGERIPLETRVARRDRLIWPGITEDMLVMAGDTDDGLSVFLMDLEGNVLLDQTYPCDWLEGRHTGFQYCGRDETNVYLYSIGYSNALFAVALDGSGARILWDSDTGAY